MLRKNDEKSAKIKVFGYPKPSQNPSKTPPKSMFQQTCDFSSIFASKSLCSKSADIDFVLVFTIQNGSRTFFFELLFACIFDPKNLPKTFRNHARAASKTFLKMHCFFTSVCKRLGLHFKASWTPRWNRVRHFAFQKLTTVDLGSLLK